MKEYRSTDESKNGVRVKVTRSYEDGELVGSTVDASCQCFGHPRRVHSDVGCPNRVRQARHIGFDRGVS